MTRPKQLPTLPGCVDGVVGHDLTGWTVQCRDCGRTSTNEVVLLAIRERETRFHTRGWPDGSNPRLCRECRLNRGCHCQNCEEERQGTDFPILRGHP